MPEKEEWGNISFSSLLEAAGRSHSGFTLPRLAKLRCIELAKNKEENQRLLLADMKREQFPTDEANVPYSHHRPLRVIISQPICAQNHHIARLKFIHVICQPLHKVEKHIKNKLVLFNFNKFQ